MFGFGILDRGVCCGWEVAGNGSRTACHVAASLTVHRTSPPPRRQHTNTNTEIQTSGRTRSCSDAETVVVVVQGLRSTFGRGSAAPCRSMRAVVVVVVVVVVRSVVGNVGMLD